MSDPIEVVMEEALRPGRYNLPLDVAAAAWPYALRQVAGQDAPVAVD